ncbi:hypothetical protein FQR65_LT14882 [Abscondita terminalis]|nr:hypothetical protein FQR65_LT14882 [Abscondita terminalis]
MLLLIFIIIGIGMVSIVTYLVIKFCFQSNLKTSYVRSPGRSPRNQTQDVGRPVAIIVHSSSSTGNIEIDYLDLPPSYSRSNSIQTSPPSYDELKTHAHD